MAEHPSTPPEKKRLAATSQGRQLWLGPHLDEHVGLSRCRGLEMMRGMCPRALAEFRWDVGNCWLLRIELSFCMGINSSTWTKNLLNSFCMLYQSCGFRLNYPQRYPEWVNKNGIKERATKPIDCMCRVCKRTVSWFCTRAYADVCIYAMAAGGHVQSFHIKMQSACAY